MSKTTNKFSPEVRERAVRLVFDNVGQHGSRWQVIMSIAAKIGYAPQTLSVRARRDEAQRLFTGADHGGAPKPSNMPTLEWVHWFNNRRLLEPIGNIPPAEAEENFHAALETAAIAA